MVTQFKTLIELFDTYKDEATCKALLAQQRWGANPACPRCGSLKPYVTNRGYRCSSKECAKKFSVTVGTVFENSNIKLRTWFAAMYLISTSKKGISSVQLADQLNITQKSAWFVLHRVREMLKGDVGPLSGMVEIDETYVGGKFRNKHVAIRKAMIATSNSHDHKTPVLGLLQRDGKLIIKVIEKANQETVVPMVIDNITQGTVLHTDSSHIYNPLEKQFKREVVNHNRQEYVRGNVHTNSIEGFWSIFKRGIYGIYHQVSPKHLHRYCNEFTFRYNERDQRNDGLFFLALANSEGKRLKYNDLIAN